MTPPEACMNGVASINQVVDFGADVAGIINRRFFRIGGVQIGRYLRASDKDHFLAQNFTKSQVESWSVETAADNKDKGRLLRRSLTWQNTPS